MRYHHSPYAPSLDQNIWILPSLPPLLYIHKITHDFISHHIQHTYINVSSKDI